MTLKEKRRELKLKKYSFELIQIILGSFLMASAVSLFLLPNQLSSGGFTGIATIFYYFLKLPMGISIILLNVPLFLLAFIKKGKSFVIRGILGTTFLSIFTDILDQYQALTRRPIFSLYLWRCRNGSRNVTHTKSTCLHRRKRHACLCHKRIQTTISYRNLNYDD